ncbi:MAG: hypothetical protein JXQ96_17755 [Cyclobacteriaceae bacterium]
MTNSEQSEDPEGITALFYALNENNIKMCCGGLAKFSADDNGRTPIYQC